MSRYITKSQQYISEVHLKFSAIKFSVHQSGLILDIIKHILSCFRWNFHFLFISLGALLICIGKKSSTGEAYPLCSRCTWWDYPLDSRWGLWWRLHSNEDDDNTLLNVDGLQDRSIHDCTSIGLWEWLHVENQYMDVVRTWYLD